MALLQDGVSQRGFFLIPQTLTANTTYVLRIPDTPVTGLRYAGFLSLMRLHTPTGEWSQIEGIPIWTRSTVFRVDSLSAGGNRFAVGWRDTGIQFELHNFV